MPALPSYPVLDVHFILLQGVPESVTAVAWHPHQRHLLALGCSNGAVALLDTAKGACLQPSQMLVCTTKCVKCGSNS